MLSIITGFCSIKYNYLDVESLEKAIRAHFPHCFGSNAKSFAVAGRFKTTHVY